MTRLRVEIQVSDRQLLARGNERAANNRLALEQRKALNAQGAIASSAATPAKPAPDDRNRGRSPDLYRPRRPAAKQGTALGALLFLQWKEQSLPSFVAPSPLRFVKLGRPEDPSYELKLAAATSPYRVAQLLFQPYEVGNTGFYDYGHNYYSPYGFDLSVEQYNYYKTLNPLSHVRKEFVLSLGYQGLDRQGAPKGTPTLIPDVVWQVEQRYYDQVYDTLDEEGEFTKYTLLELKEQYTMSGHRLTAIKIYKQNARTRIQFAFDHITSTRTFRKGQLNGFFFPQSTQSLGSTYNRTPNALIHTLELGKSGPTPITEAFNEDAPNLLTQLTDTRTLNNVFTGGSINSIAAAYDELGTGQSNGTFLHYPNYGWMERELGTGVYDTYPALRYLGDSSIWFNSDLQSLRLPLDSGYAITNDAGTYSVTEAPDLNDLFTAPEFEPYDITQRTYSTGGQLSFLQSCLYLAP